MGYIFERSTSVLLDKAVRVLAYILFGATVALSIAGGLLARPEAAPTRPISETRLGGLFAASPFMASVTIVAITIMIGVSFAFLNRRVFGPDDTTAQLRASQESEVEEDFGTKYLESLSRESRTVAESLFNRSGVYLIVGVVSAVLGVVAFFVSRSVLAPNLGSELGHFEYGVYLAQNTGVLIVCELIAFFFLRQSRAVIDEFRHFDALARRREEVLALLRIGKSGGSELDLKYILEQGHFFSKADRLGSGESTELIETRKLEKSELELLSRIAEVVAASKTR